MKLNPVPADVAAAGLRALKTVCLTNGTLAPIEARFLDAVQRYVLGTALDLETLAPIAPEALAQAVPPGEYRERIVRGAVLAACIDGEAARAEVPIIEDFAAALGVGRDAVRTFRRLANERVLLARINILRRTIPGYKMAEVLRERGLLGVLRQLLPTLGVEDAATTARYGALSEYPAGSLGRGWYDFTVRNRIPLPGEKGAGPEIIVIHDCLHVLGEYETTPEEEVQVAAFQSGCHGEDPFYTLLFVLAQFHLGLQMVPVAQPETLRADPELMLRAFARGCEVRRDMWTDFAPWDHFVRPLDELRRELNVPPRS
jgi:hypothetical protein